MLFDRSNSALALLTGAFTQISQEPPERSPIGGDASTARENGHRPRREFRDHVALCQNQSGGNRSKAELFHAVT